MFALVGHSALRTLPLLLYERMGGFQSARGESLLIRHCGFESGCHFSVESDFTSVRNADNVQSSFHLRQSESNMCELKRIGNYILMQSFTLKNCLGLIEFHHITLSIQSKHKTFKFKFTFSFLPVPISLSRHPALEL
jgi:hypothetical protein